MRMNKRYIILIIASILYCKTNAQQTYISPVDFPITLAGNVGEVRSNHFHSGIDIKALRGVGSPIMAIADGYISRIGVAPFGYGNFLCVTHLDGSTSLYGHLNSFAKPLAQWIKSQQYNVKSYAIDRYLQAGQFPVKAGQVVAFLGNSGSSAGPHLHLEIRDKTTQNPINMIAKGIYKVPDHIPPTLKRIFVYQSDTIENTNIFHLTQTIDIQTNSDGTLSPSTKNITLSKPAYLAYEVIDYKDGRTNTMGIYSIEQKVDNQVNFAFKQDHVSFATTRYINSYTQFGQNKKSKYNVVRAYVSDNNRLNIYEKVVNSGLLDPTSQQVTTNILDDNNNCTQIALNVVYNPTKPALVDFNKNEKLLKWNSDFSYNDGSIIVNIMAKSLYESTMIYFGKDTTQLCERFIVGNADIPLQNYISLKIKANSPEKLRTKALIIKVLNNGKVISCGGQWNNNFVETKVREFGKFEISYDTIAPKITPLQENMKTVRNPLRFKISDELSGIANYNIIIDGIWALGEYDPKNTMLICNISPTSTPKKHNVTIQVTDNKQNTTTQKAIYQW